MLRLAHHSRRLLSCRSIVSCSSSAKCCAFTFECTSCTHAMTAPTTVTHSARFIYSPAVVQNVSPSTSVSQIGNAIQDEAVAAAFRIPPSLLHKLKTPREITFTKMDLARALYAPLIQTIDDKVDYRHLERHVAQKYANESNPTSETQNGKDASEGAVSTSPSSSSSTHLQPVQGALRKFTETRWEDMLSLLTFYEEVMYPIRIKYNEFLSHQLTSFHIKDVLKRGLTAFKQDFIDSQKQELVQVQAKMAECEKYIQDAAKDAFVTDFYNDLINVLRIAGEKYEHAHGMAEKLLQDMNMLKIPYNDVTMALVQAVVFNDGPFDSSPLLFEIIEAPERGEVSLSTHSLESISDDMLKLISNRHQTPLDDGLLLHSTDTHPLLQRSLE